MANFDDFKQKAKDTMETIADRSVEFYKIAEEKTKIFAKITKLGAEIALEKGNVRKLYREIGSKYYELHKASPEDALAQTCTEVTGALENIAAKQKEIEELKNSYDLGVKDEAAATDDDKDVEIEIIVEEFDKPEQDEAAGKPEPSGESAIGDDETDGEDIIGKSPPEFKI
jgi:hypothetical protein